MRFHERTQLQKTLKNLTHHVGTYYRDATRVHEDGATFIWERTYHDSLRRFRDAVLRRGYAMRKLYVNRIHTNLVGVISDTDRMKYSSLASITQAGHTTLTPAFAQAVSYTHLRAHET